MNKELKEVLKDVSFKSPFWTAFKVTLGIAFAQLVTAGLFFGGLALVAYAFVKAIKGA